MKKKIISILELSKKIALLRKKNKNIALCHGVFDLLHPGHISHLNQAKKLADILVVSLTPDRYVNKGPSRPAFTEKLRAETISSLEVVDYVVINTNVIPVPDLVRVCELTRSDNF